MTIKINYEQLNDAQREAVTLGDRNAVVVSVPGSGKSTCLVNRIAHLIANGVEPENILAITFAKEAATNMEEKLRTILGMPKSKIPDLVDKVTINTFHAFTFRLLKANDPYWKANGDKMSREFEYKKLMEEIVKKILKLAGKDETVDVPKILQFITYQKNQALSPDDDLVHVPEMPYKPSVMKKIYFQWEKLKKEYKIVGFDDMTWEGYKLIRDNDKLRKMIQGKFKYILADEKNDATQLQYDILRLIGLKANSVVIFGDPLQEIYQFLGASNKHMKNFVNDFDNVKVINSNINYRSQSKIIDLYNKFIIPSPETQYKYYSPAKAHRPAGKDVEYNVFFNGMEEAKWIGDKIKHLVDVEKYKYSDILLLYRTNSQSRPFEEVFMKNEIPYHISDGTSFYNRKEIKDIMSYLRLINNPLEDESWDRIANIPNRFFGAVLKDEVSEFSKRNKVGLYDSMLTFPRRNEWRYKSHIDKFESVIHKCKTGLGRYKISTIIDTLRKELDYDQYLTKEYGEKVDNNRIDNLNSFQTQGEDFKDLGQFIKNIDALTQSNEDKTSQQFKSKKDRVELKSCHSSKGLEAPVVFVVGFSEGLMPHHMNENIEAERLLAYVALSRARDEMYVSSILNHNKKELEVSSFLYDCFDEEMIEEKVEECWDRAKSSFEENKKSGNK